MYFQPSDLYISKPKAGFLFYFFFFSFSFRIYLFFLSLFFISLILEAKFKNEKRSSCITVAQPAKVVTINGLNSIEHDKSGIFIDAATHDIQESVSNAEASSSDRRRSQEPSTTSWNFKAMFNLFCFSH